MHMRCVFKVYPEIDSQSQIAIRIRALIMETKQKLNDPKNVHMYSELQVSVYASK